MKKNFKRWTALLLAVLMVLSTCLYSADSFLWAADGETESFDATVERGAVVENTADTDAGTIQVEDPGPVTETQEIVIPEQADQLEAEANTAQPEADTEPVQEEAEDVPSEAADTPADVSLGQTVEVTPSENVENTYNVTFYRPAVEGGTLRVWTEGSEKKDVAYIDGRYTEEVKEGTTLYFEIKCTGNYFVDQIMDQNGAAVGAESINGNISTYKMAINGNMEITILYREVPKEDASEETTEETAEDVTENEEKDETSEKEAAEDNNYENDKNNLSEAMDKASQIFDNMKSSPSLLAITDGSGNTKEVTIAIGETITLEDSEGANALGSNTWESDNTEAVSVVKNSNNGKEASVIGLAEGEAIITHSWKGFMGWGGGSNTFKVIVKDVKVSNISIIDTESGNPVDSLSMNTYEEASLTAVILPENATNKEVAWSSSDLEIVTVENGKVTARKAGSAMITAAAKDGSGTSVSIAVEVTDVAVESIHITSDSGSRTVNVNGTLLLKAEVLPENATDQSVEWISDDNNIATVNENGLVTGISEGTVTIRAKHDETEDTIQLIVQRNEMTGFDVLADKTRVVVGNTVKVSAIIQPEGYPNRSVTWTSSDETIAAVDSNGIVTTTGTGMVTIKGIANDNQSFFDEVIIQVEDVKAEKVTITGNDKTFLIAGVGELDLKAAVEPENAKDKEIEWSTSDETIATVDRNGHVVAVGQGKVIIRAENPSSGAYDEVAITVYDSAPLDLDIQVWVTNQYQKSNVGIHVPADGTPIDPHSAMSEIFTNGDKSYKFTGIIRYSELIGDQPVWSDLQTKDIVKKLRYNTKLRYVEYTTVNNPGENDWKRVEQNNNGKLCAFYEFLRGATNDGSDVNIVIGDWPYGDNEGSGHDNHTIQVKVINDDTGNEIYDSGVMRYDNNSNGYYGKIKLGCDTSRYEVDYATIQDSNGTLERIDADEISPEGISVLFQSGKKNRYVIVAHIKAKEFHVSYDANGGTGNVPETEHIKAVNGQTVTVAGNPVPTREDYIFAGWEYAGTNYSGGDTFEMPPNDIVFKAKWIQASKVINYIVNDENMGTVTNPRDIIKSDTTSVQGSVANAKPGYRFAGWYENGQLVTEEKVFVPVGQQIKAVTYEARFEASVYTITAQVINGSISPNGMQTVYYGNSLKLTYNAAPGYVLESVVVDGRDASINKDSYTFVNVTDNHIITVTYKRDTSGFSIIDIDKEYDGNKAGITSAGTLLEGEKWQYSENGEEWQDSNFEYVDVTARGSDEKGRPVYARVISGDTVIWNNDDAPAYVRITPKSVIVTANAEEKMYGRLDPIFTANVTGLLGNDSVKYTVNRPGAGTDEAVRVYQGAIEAAGEEEQGNYKVSFEPADFTIKTNTEDLTLTAEDGGGEYNANPYKLRNVEASLEDAVMEYKVGDSDWTTEEPSVTDVEDSLDKTISVRASLAGYQTVVLEDRSIEVTRKPVTVTANAAEKLYGREDPVFTAKVDGNLNGDHIEYSVSRPGKGTDEAVDVYPGAIEAAGEEDQGNYRVSFEPADFTIKTNTEDLILTAGNGGGVYNGTPYRLNNVEASLKDAVIEYKVGNGQWTTEEPRVTDAEDSLDGTISVRAMLEGYKDAIIEGRSIFVTPRSVHLKSGDASKVYDGEALTNSDLTITGDGFILGEATAAATGTITYVGKTANTIEIKEGKNYKEKNYSISTEEGLLTITDGDHEKPVNPDDVVIKTHDDKEYGLDDKIEFIISVTNIYDTPKTISISEQPGVKIEGETTFANVQPGATVTTTALYTVTETDLIAGIFKNSVKASFEGEKEFENTDTVTELEAPNAELFIYKEATNREDAPFKEGAEIQYAIRVKNAGNLTLTNVYVTDPLTGASTMIDSLLPDAEQLAFNTSYKVTSEDVVNGSVINETLTTADSSDPNTPVTIWDDMVSNPTVTYRPSLFVEKEATADENGDGTYTLGEKISYMITVTNNGSVTITGIDVKDDLTGEIWEIDSLAPGAKQSFNTTYSVESEDILTGSIVNVATASGTDPNGNTVENDVAETVRTDKVNTSYTVKKEIVNPQAQYNVGDTIRYRITVASVADATNVALHNIVVSDQLTGAAGTVTFTELNGATLNDDNTVTISSLAPEEAVTLECQYTVVRTDAGNNIVNTAIASPDPVVPTDPENPEPIDPGEEEDPADPAPIENIYNLTIHYVYAAGSTAAPDVVGQYLAGESFSYTSPAIDGYTPSIGVLRSDRQGMPAKDVEVTIIYTAIPAVPAAVPAPAAPVPVAPAPVAPAPAAPVAALVPVPDDPVPAAAVVVDEDDNVDVVPVLDEEVPLTNRELDEHHCCLLHFLLMLTALIIFAFYMSSMKKRQTRIAELTDELETEVVKRKLGLADDKTNMSL